MDAIKTLDSLIKSQAHVRDVNLEYSAIDDKSFRGAVLPRLKQLGEIETLDLSRNRLQSLPKDLSQELPNLTSLNISGNFFTDMRKTIDGLSSLPNLVDLEADITAKDEKLVFERLPKLRRLNKVSLTGDAKIPSKPSNSREDVSLTTEDLKEVVQLYGSVRKLRGSGEKLTAELTEKFDRHVNKTMSELSSKLDAASDPRMKDPFLRQAEMLLAKHKLFELCFSELCNVADSQDRNFGKALRKMKSVHKQLFEEFPVVLHEMRPHYKRRIADMQDEVVRAERETAQLLQAAEMLEKEAEAHSEQKEIMAEKFEKERNRLVLENKRLREANESLRRQATEGGRVTSIRSSAKKKSRAAESKTRSSSSKKKHSPIKIGNVTVRDLSLKQLKDHINSIYASKIAFDEKCKDAHLPRETMEQHMYTYLNQKYGLRKLIVEHATSIIKATHMYAEKDNDVDVFRCIIENRIDEEFRLVQDRLKDTVSELLRVYLKGKFPRKTDDAISKLLKIRLEGHVYEEEWIDIVKYMYNREDSLNLVTLIKNTIRSQPVPPEPKIGRGHPRAAKKILRSDDPVKLGKIKFTHFLHHLLTFQLAGHRSFLSKFYDTFQIYDTDKNGVLDEDQMRMLIRDVDSSKTDSQINAILQDVDPYNNQNITYSECVNALSNELVSSMS